MSEVHDIGVARNYGRTRRHAFGTFKTETLLTFRDDLVTRVEPIHDKRASTVWIPFVVDIRDPKFSSDLLTPMRLRGDLRPYARISK